jgi:two-component system sensor histidine kinase/response regulator
MKGDREKCLEAGMDDYMSKPIEPAAMAAMLERWLCDLTDSDAPLDAVVPAPGNGQEADACDVTDLDTPLDKVLPVPGNGREPDAEAPAVFDRQNFQNRVLGDEDVMKLVIEKFLSDIPEQIDLLAAASSDGDCECVSKLGHKIRGAAANIGAEALRSAAFEFEQAGKDGDIERVRSLQPGFTHLFDELHEAFIREGLAE